MGLKKSKDKKTAKEQAPVGGVSRETPKDPDPKDPEPKAGKRLVGGGGVDVKILRSCAVEGNHCEFGEVVSMREGLAKGLAAMGKVQILEAADEDSGDE